MVAFFPKFGVGGRNVSLPPDLFHLLGHTLKIIQIPGGGGRRGDSNRSGMCNVKPYTVSESIIHFTNMGAAY